MVFPKELWTNIIFNHLDGRDGSRLLRVCKKMKSYVESCNSLMYKINIHWIEIERMDELHRWIHPESRLIHSCKLETFRRYGYIGEAVLTVEHEDELTLFNDFYDIQYINWENLAKNLKAKNYVFYIVKYPTRKSFDVLPYKEIHRDGTIIVKWKKNEEDERKKCHKRMKMVY
jgi:hypothetical protein